MAPKTLDHLKTYKALIHLYVVHDGIMCRAFPTTLKGSSRRWFNKPKPGSISSFTELSKQIVGHFIQGQRYKRSAMYLLNIKQNSDKSHKHYMSRFNQEVLLVDNADAKSGLDGPYGRFAVVNIHVLPRQESADQHYKVHAQSSKAHECERHHERPKGARPREE